MRRQRRSSLGTKLVSLTSFVAVIAILSLTFLSIYRERENFEEDLVNRARLLLKTSSYSIRDALYRQQIDELADYARIVDEDSEVTLFIVYDAEGKTLADSTYPGIMPFSQTVDKRGKAILSFRSGEHYQKWEDDQLVVGQPVVIGNQTIGAIAIGLSTQQLVEKINEITRQSIQLAFGITALGILAGYGVIRQITNPLRDLAEAATAMSHGKSPTQLNVKSNDEIGRLTESFNQMAASIQERESDLRKLTNQLEQTVEVRTAELREKTEILETLAITDPLTKAYNRRYFFDLAYKHMEIARDSNVPLSVIILDADHFKAINDTYGHQVGDEILIQLVKTCQKTIRKTDILARYGGEEFIILMPEADKETAYRIAERLRSEIENSTLLNNKIKMTISLGIATWKAPDMLLEILVANADKALYQSKEDGRNQTTIWKS